MWRDIYFEIVKLKAQKKNYIVAIGHLCFLGLCYLGMKTSNMSFMERRVRRSAELDLTDFLGYVDGLMFARLALIPAFIVIMPIFICTLAGDSVAGEIQDGSLKLFAARPRSRTRIIMAKFWAIFIWNFIFCIYFSLTGLIVGILLFGMPGSQLIYLGRAQMGTVLVMMPLGQAMVAYWLTAVYFSVSMMALGCVTLFLSTIFNRMTAASVGGIVIYFICYVAEKLPFMEAVRPYLLSKVMNGAVVFWLTDVPMRRVMVNLSTLSLYICVFTGLALIVFNSKDIK
jgi:ABC-2 type transport system permease protein